MEKDLKWIKKHYGEQMMHLSRKLFYRILETEGVLSKVFDDHIEKDRYLAEEIINQGEIDKFKSYIFSYVNIKQETEEQINTNKTAKQLLDEVGYVLYPECKREEDIQQFKKYYKSDEEICTFRGERLKTCRVWFAVKKNVDDIRRENYKTPQRQDEYGTSVISIQFSKISSSLSIKNRYNQAVTNPDNTFNSDLNNICWGLADAFERDFGVKDKFNKQTDFEVGGYVNVKNKVYAYNYEINNIYYCPNNRIIDNFEVKQLPNSQMLIDYFIFDFKNKTIKVYDRTIKDSFIDTIGEIEGMDFKNNTITIKVRGGSEIVVKIDDKRRIISLTNKNVIECGDGFLQYNEVLSELNLEQLVRCENKFLYENRNLIKLILPKLKRCGERFLYLNRNINQLELPKLEDCGTCFLRYNQKLEELSLPNLTNCQHNFLDINNTLKKLNLPRLESCGSSFLERNNCLTNLNAPNLIKCGSGFLQENDSLKQLSMPNLIQCGTYFISHNSTLEELNLPNLVECGNSFLRDNTSLRRLDLPKLQQCGTHSLYKNANINVARLIQAVNI